MTDIPERVEHNGRTYDLVDRANEVWGLQLDGEYLGVLNGPSSDENPETDWVVVTDSEPYKPSTPSFATWGEALTDYFTQREPQREPQNATLGGTEAPVPGPRD